jgi:transposase, IS5 family
LDEVNKLIDWKKFLPLIPRKSRVGNPGYQIILKLKILFLQSWYNISDEEMEFQIHDRLSFQMFLGSPTSIPYFTTIWRFRERLQEDDVAESIWKEMQRQLFSNNLEVEQGVIQDAKVIQSPKGKDGSLNHRGREAKTSRSKDGTWTKKHGHWEFGYKLHTKVENKTKLITEIAVTTARVHDANVDLTKEDEVGYRDKAYCAQKCKAKGNAAMKKGNLSIWDKLRNKRITRTRCRGEHQYGAMTRMQNAGTTKLTTVPRVYIQQIFSCMVYNFNRLLFLMR